MPSKLPHVLLALAVVVAVACSSSKDPPAHPALVVDCQPPPVSSASGPACPGVCLQFEECDGAGTTCPDGLLSAGRSGCANQALCCVLPDDGGADAGPDGSPRDDAASSDATIADSAAGD